MTEAEAIDLAVGIVYRLRMAAQNENINLPLVLGDGLYLDVKAALLAASRPGKGFIRTHEGKDLRVLGTLVPTADGCIVGHGAEMYTHRRGQNGFGVVIGRAYNRCDFLSRFYSTREAAEAAKGGGQ